VFSLSLSPHRIVFGAPFADVLDAELDALGAKRFFLVAGRRGGEIFEARASAETRARLAGAFRDSVAHVPESVAERAAAALAASRADVVVAFGGGASLDTAKAAAMQIGKPILAVPTNFSGSEVTPNFGLSDKAGKRTVVSPDVQPRTVIYDPSLVASLPAAEAVTSGVNAMAHAVEALYAADANPLTAALAVEGVRRLAEALERWHGQGHDAHAEGLTGAWLCGEALGQVGMGLHHRICHVLGGRYVLPHAATHTVLLPHTVAFNEPFAPALKPLAEIFQRDSLAEGLAAFARRGGAPRALRQLGFPEALIEPAAAHVLASPLRNPRPVALEDVRRILTDAWRGAPVAASPHGASA